MTHSVPPSSLKNSLTSRISILFLVCSFSVSSLAPPLNFGVPALGLGPYMAALPHLHSLLCPSHPVLWLKATCVLPAPKFISQILTCLLSSDSLLSISTVMSTKCLELSLSKAELSLFLPKPAPPSLPYLRSGNSIHLGAWGHLDLSFFSYPMYCPSRGKSFLLVTRSPTSELWSYE